MKLHRLIPEYIRLAVFDTLLVVLLMWWDPSGINLSLERSIDHTAAIATQFLPTSRKRENLAVVLIDDDALKSWNVAWPLTYDVVADIADRLACAGAVAVFFDFTATSFRNPEDGEAHLRETAGVPDGTKNTKPRRCGDGRPPPEMNVYFADLPKVTSKLQDDLKAKGRTFLIQWDSEDNVYPSSAADFPAHTPLREEITPAFGLLNELCPPSEKGEKRFGWCPSAAVDENSPVFLMWNGNPDPKQTAVLKVPECRLAIGDSWGARLWAGLKWSFTAKSNRCLPILTLNADSLFKYGSDIKEYGDPSAELKGRVVFVGMSLEGVRDDVESLVFGRIQGVYAHAVAFDNLITYGGRHYTAPEPGVKWVFIAVLLFAINATVATFFQTPAANKREGHDPKGSASEKENFVATLWSKLRRTTQRERRGGALIVALIGLSLAFVWYNCWPYSYLVTAFALVGEAEGLESFYRRFTSGWSNSSEES